MIYEVLILGGGYGALRYVESLIWDSMFSITLCGMEKLRKTRVLADRFALPYITFDSLDKTEVNKYACIIVALPIDVKRYYVEYLLQELCYTNTLIIEKPLALAYKDLFFYKKELRKHQRYAIVCQRDFFPEEYEIQSSDKYDIVFPSREGDEYFNIVNMLPHILSWLITNDDSLEMVKRGSKNHFKGIWKQKELSIEFVQRTENNLALVNGKCYPNVQYRRTNAEIVKKVLDFDVEKSEESLQKAIKVSKFIINILEEMYL